MKLLKYLATAGVASRRKAEQLIRGGKVTVSSETVREPATEITGGLEIQVEGRPVKVEQRRYLLLHKPKGVITTAKDPHGRRTVLDLIDIPERVYPVGRLDADSSGLLLLTNDGELADKLLHPRYESDKTYRVRTVRPVNDADLAKLRGGIELDDGPTAPAAAERVARNEFEITIHEGRNRQVRRMVEAIGNEVADLIRVRVAGVELGDLTPGRHRPLTEAERKSLGL